MFDGSVSSQLDDPDAYLRSAERGRNVIGVVGPTDSIELVLDVASESGLSDHVTGRAYDRVGEGVAIARDLDRFCRVIIFTGEAPYSLARKEVGWRATLDYLPHSVVDLYRTLVKVIQDHGGAIPRMVIDTITQPEVLGGFRDLGLPPPEHFISLQDDDGDLRSVAGLVDAHRMYHLDHGVELSLTCMGSVQSTLAATGLPTYRIDHTRSAIQGVLQRSALASKLARSERTQIAIALIDVDMASVAPREGSSLYDTQRRRLSIHRSLVDFAEGLYGTLAVLDERTFVVHTTRGSIENALDRRQQGHASGIEPSGVDATTSVGYGFGSTVVDAEANAHRALKLSRSSGETHLAFSDGQIEGIDEVARSNQNGGPGGIASSQLGLGSLAFSRLLAALRGLDITSVSALEFATAYGVTPRSARRLFTQMERAGVASELEAVPRRSGPGRPSKRYRIDLEKLTSLAITEPEPAKDNDPGVE